MSFKKYNRTNWTIEAFQNVLSVNIDNKMGAIGFFSRIIPSVYPVSLIKVDEDGEPIRNSKGLCQVCEPSKLTKQD